jgi:NADH:ubiquinone oxidoreductase subunit 6 (subunit J)
MPQRLSTKSTAFILLGIAVLLMPVGAMVGGATQWVVIAGSVVILFLCAYNINVNNRRSGRS